MTTTIQERAKEALKAEYEKEGPRSTEAGRARYEKAIAAIDTLPEDFWSQGELVVARNGFVRLGAHDLRNLILREIA